MSYKFEPNTVGYLKKFLEENNIPDDAIIYYQRIEDVYFEKHNWTTIKKEGQFYHEAVERNKKIDSGEFSNKEKYPKMKDPENYRTIPEELELLKEQYIESWCPVKYKDDNNLYIDAHY